MTDLTKLWRRKEFPDADCVVRRDGTMVIMSSEQVTFDSSAPCVVLDVVAASTLASYFTYNDESSLAPLTTLFRVGDTGGWFEGGESADGRAGWFSYGEDAGEPLWVAYFRSSNPFVSGSLSDNELTVENNHGQSWSASIAAPERLRAD